MHIHAFSFHGNLIERIIGPANCNMGLNVRKPVFGVCEQQRRRPACCTYGQTDQCLVVHFLKSIISELATSQISSFKLVSVAEETGLSLAFSEAPKTGFVTMRPI